MKNIYLNKAENEFEYSLSKFGIESIALIHKEGLLKDFLIAKKGNFIFYSILISTNLK